MGLERPLKMYAWYLKTAWNLFSVQEGFQVHIALYERARSVLMAIYCATFMHSLWHHHNPAGSPSRLQEM